MSDIPLWAIERAQDLFHHEQPEITPLQWRKAFARYIAAHEEAPVDPLVEALRPSVANAEQFAEVLRRNLAKRGLEIRPVQS